MELRCQTPEEKCTIDGWLYDTKTSREIWTKCKEVGVIGNKVVIETLRIPRIAPGKYRDYQEKKF